MSSNDDNNYQEQVHESYHIIQYQKVMIYQSSTCLDVTIYGYNFQTQKRL